jgi:hypothetical protein
MMQHEGQHALANARVSRRKLGLVALGIAVTIAGIGVRGSAQTALESALLNPTPGSGADGHIVGCACPLCTGRRGSDLEHV